jgi:mono/diheme cytochrome c family protein
MTATPRVALAAVTLTLIVNASVVLRSTREQNQTAKPPVSTGWTLPATAAEEKNPLAVNDAVLAAGRKLFLAKCERCHGSAGKGNGPEADKHHLEHMDLTQKARAARHPDGIVFYKVWNGRSAPKMPAFKEELTRDQAWAIVAYVQTLRGK